MATTVAPTTNPWDAAMNPEVKSGGNTDYFGQINISTWFCTLIKGMGKVPFDPQSHSMDQRRTAIEMSIIPLADMNVSWDVSRNLIAESREWAGIVLPSIKNLGISAQELDGKWVHIARKETGNMYTSKTNGNQYPEMTFEFKQVFADEQACRTAYQQFSSGAGAPPPATPAPATNGNGTAKEKETAAKFLGPIVANAVRGQTDLDVIRNTVSANITMYPMVAKFFTVDSPEVAALIMAEMSK